MPVHVTRRWDSLASLAIIFTFTLHFGCYWNKASLKAHLFLDASIKDASNHSNRFVKAISISVCIPAIPRDVESGCLDELVSSIKRQLSKTLGATSENVEMERYGKYRVGLRRAASEHRCCQKALHSPAKLGLVSL